MKITEAVHSLLEPVVNEMGYELDEVEYIKEHGNMVLTLYIEAPQGITLEDCEAVSRRVDPLLDERDIIKDAYYLSVSSIGIDRPLKKEKDFIRSMGEEIEVKLYVPLNKKKEFCGTLVAHTEDSFTIKPQKGENITFLKKDTALVRPHIDFKKLSEQAIDFSNDTEIEVENE